MVSTESHCKEAKSSSEQWERLRIAPNTTALSTPKVLVGIIQTRHQNLVIRLKLQSLIVIT